MRARAVLVVIAILGVVATAACDPSGPSAEPPQATGPVPNLAAGHSANWSSYHGGRLRHGLATTMPPVRGRMRIVSGSNLDGQVYASTLVIGGATIVATENNTVSAFGPRLRLKWKRHLGSPSPQSERPCGNIDPLGITGTPVYDAGNNAVFV